MEESQSQPQLGVTDCRDTRIIGKIRDSLLSQGSKIDPSVIERRILELFTSFRAPTHPPYALMIQRAVMELNDPNGSTEDAISEFIKKEFKDLPWAHVRILGLHLGKLCRDKELLRTESGRYKLMVDCDQFGKRKETGWRGSKKRKKRKRRRNHSGGETLEGIEGTERSNELQEQENEEQNQLSELHGTGTNGMIEEQEKSEIGPLGMTEECHGRVFQPQVEVETPQNRSTGEPIQEAIMELNDKIRSSEIMNTEPHMGKKQNSIVIKKHVQCKKQPYNLLTVAEDQTCTRQIGVATGISRFCSNEISNNENSSASLGSPTKKLQISEQEGQHENETLSIQQKFSGACELLVDQEGPICHLETTYSSQPTAPEPPVDLTSNSWNCLTVPLSTEFLECTQSEGIELTPTQLLMQTSKYGTPETDLCAATKMLASSSSMTVHEHNQSQDWILGSPKGRVDNNTIFGDLEKHVPRPQCSERQPNQKLVADYPLDSLLPSDASIVDRQKPKYYKIKKQLQLQPEGRGRGRGRGRGCSRGRGRSRKLDRNPHEHQEQLQLQDQVLGSVSFPSLEPNDTIYSSPAPNQQQLGDPTSEESPGCIPWSTRYVSRMLQSSWHRLTDGDFGTTSMMEDSLSFLNVYEDKLQQHGNNRVPKQKLNLDGKNDFRHLEQQPPKRRQRS